MSKIVGRGFSANLLDGQGRVPVWHGCAGIGHRCVRSNERSLDMDASSRDMDFSISRRQVEIRVRMMEFARAMNCRVARKSEA